MVGIERGADDYVVKPFHWDVLIARVRTLLRRAHAGQSEILYFEDLVLDTSLREARRGERSISLTSKEYDLLLEFIEHPRRVLPRDYLMDRVWGYELVGGTSVLDTYMKQLRHKLEAVGELRLIHTIRGVGYVLREP